MLKTFKHKGLDAFFAENNPRFLNPQHVGRIKRILDLLDDALKVEELNIPGYGLHSLKGDRNGELSMKVSGNWRITFRFEDGHVFNVNLEDYH
ncbi:MAG: type II toxin-antitoxin system RelE/ParE family toxin [Rectinemataceae bacterium]|nr:type II toxin-antitoxin system RelE/ParE family toxin [Rectinemataceae bacterium]